MTDLEIRQFFYQVEIPTKEYTKFHERDLSEKNGLVDKIFSPKWLSVRPKLQYALDQNQNYRGEVNCWLRLFESRGWLNKKLIKRLQSASSWASYYSKINELRSGYFFERKIGIKLIKYEAPTIDGKNVEFGGKFRDQKILIEVKTPINPGRKPYYTGSFNSTKEVIDCLNKAIPKLPNNLASVVVLSDDLDVTLFYDFNALNSIWLCFDDPKYKNISAVCVLGNIYRQDRYKMLWATNKNANVATPAKLFKGYPEIHRL